MRPGYWACGHPVPLYCRRAVHERHGLAWLGGVSLWPAGSAAPTAPTPGSQPTTGPPLLPPPIFRVSAWLYLPAPHLWPVPHCHIHDCYPISRHHVPTTTCPLASPPLMPLGPSGVCLAYCQMPHSWKMGRYGLVRLHYRKDRFWGEGESRGPCPEPYGSLLGPEPPLEGPPTAGEHDIIAVEGTRLSYPGQSVHQALTVH